MRRVSMLLLSLPLMQALGCGDDDDVPTVPVPAAEASMVNGTGTCSDLALPSRCLPVEGYQEFDAFCMVGPGSQISTTLAPSTFPDGCVGAVAVLRPEVMANIDDLTFFGMWVTPGRCQRAPAASPSDPACEPEQKPDNARRIIVSLHPKARALFVRSAEPVIGPAQVSGVIRSLLPQPIGSWAYRMVVGTEAR